MMDEILEQARNLQQEARRLRKKKQPAEALEALREAIDQLEKENAVLDEQADEDPGWVEEQRRSVFKELAECHGVCGGILRRLGQLEESVAAYEQGRRYEQDPSYGVEDSYNLVNALVVPLLEDPHRLAGDLGDQLRLAAKTVHRQAIGSRRLDYWAHADLARCHLLLGRREEALQALDKFVETGGVKDGLDTTVQMLEELAEALSAAGLEESELLRAGVRHLRDASAGLRPVSQRSGCFVLMPFGKKSDAAGREIDFDAVYRNAIAPAITDAGLQPIRADMEKDGVIHTAMFERLMIADFAVADLSLDNANVFYELGVRHGSRARCTVLISARQDQPPFDVRMLRTLFYGLDDSGGLPRSDVRGLKRTLTKKLRKAQEDRGQLDAGDNPLPKAVFRAEGPTAVDWSETEVYRNRHDEQRRLERAIEEAVARDRDRGLRDLRKIDDGLFAGETDLQAFVALLRAYYGLSAWDDMIALAERMPQSVRETREVREQKALALNRRNEGADRYAALGVLEELVEEKGPTSETLGLIGRIYKDMFRAARESEKYRSRGLLRSAIDAYRRGLATDLSDVYPGVNLVSLLEIQRHHDPPRANAAQEELDAVVPVVRYAVELDAGDANKYWTHASRMELAVAVRDRDAAFEHLENALAQDPDPPSRESTADNLTDIHIARTKAESSDVWLEELIAALRNEVS